MDLRPLINHYSNRFVTEDRFSLVRMPPQVSNGDVNESVQQLQRERVGQARFELAAPTCQGGIEG